MNTFSPTNARPTRHQPIIHPNHVVIHNQPIVHPSHAVITKQETWRWVCKDWEEGHVGQASYGHPL